MSMTKDEIIASLKDQAKDKDILANGERDSIFTRDAQALREAAEMLEKSEVIKHGRWIEYPAAHYHKCSECKCIVPYAKAMLINGRRRYNYCPHCGAKMDGGKDDAQE